MPHRGENFKRFDVAASVWSETPAERSARRAARVIWASHIAPTPPPPPPTMHAAILHNTDGLRHANQERVQLEETKIRIGCIKMKNISTFKSAQP